MEQIYLEKYQGLYAPTSFWDLVRDNPYYLQTICNGVGSEYHWSYHIIPNTIWGLDITPASDIHDYMYTDPKSFPAIIDGIFYTGLEWKQFSDRILRNNVQRLFDMADAKSWLSRQIRPFRNMRCDLYYNALDKFGGISFWEGKNAPENMGLPATS